MKNNEKVSLVETLKEMHNTFGAVEILKLIETRNITEIEFSNGNIYVDSLDEEGNMKPKERLKGWKISELALNEFAKQLVYKVKSESLNGNSTLEFNEGRVIFTIPPVTFSTHITIRKYLTLQKKSSF